MLKKINLAEKNIIITLAIFAFFTEIIRYNFTFYFQFKIYHLIYTVLLVYLIIKKRHFVIEKISTLITNLEFIFILILFSFFSIINLGIGNTTLSLLGKQVLGLVLYVSFFYLLIKYCEEDLKILISIYLNIAFFVSVIGIFQELAYLLNNVYFIRKAFLPLFRFLFSGNGYFCSVIPLHFAKIFGISLLRINSILTEPSSFCLVLTPAFFISLASILRNSFSFLSKIGCWLVLCAFLLSFSFLGYFGLLISICLLLYKTRYRILIIIAPVLLILIAYFFITPFKIRVNSAFEILTGQTKLEKDSFNRIKMDHTDQSSFTLFINALVTIDVLKGGAVIFGNGLGSHLISYNKFLKKNKIKAPPPRFIWFLNKKDANSLFLRLLSETGLFGLFLFIWFVLKNFLPKSRDDFLWIINNSIFILIILRLIRQGNYFSEGFIFFLWVYYYTKIKSLELEGKN